MENVVKPYVKNYLHQVKAKVITYDHNTNLATIAFNSIHGQGYVTLFGVPVQLGSGGVHSAGPFQGDDVWVSFHNGDIKLPTVVALSDDDHKNNTRRARQKHARKGSYVPDSICSRSGW